MQSLDRLAGDSLIRLVEVGRPAYSGRYHALGWDSRLSIKKRELCTSVLHSLPSFHCCNFLDMLYIILEPWANKALFPLSCFCQNILSKPQETSLDNCVHLWLRRPWGPVRYGNATHTNDTCRICKAFLPCTGVWGLSSGFEITITLPVLIFYKIDSANQALMNPEMEKRLSTAWAAAHGNKSLLLIFKSG